MIVQHSWINSKKMLNMKKKMEKNPKKKSLSTKCILKIDENFSLYQKLCVCMCIYAMLCH